MKDSNRDELLKAVVKHLNGLSGWVLIITFLLIINFIIDAFSQIEIYNYTQKLDNMTIMMYYDEPITEAQWQEMEEADEEEHEEWAEANDDNYDNDNDDEKEGEKEEK